MFPITVGNQSLELDEIAVEEQVNCFKVTITLSQLSFIDMGGYSYTNEYVKFQLDAFNIPKLSPHETIVVDGLSRVFVSQLVRSQTLRLNYRSPSV